MFSFNNEPRSTRARTIYTLPRSFAKTAEQMEQEVNLQDFLKAIASAASTVNSSAEPWVPLLSAHLQKPGTTACHNTNKSTPNNKFEVKVHVANFSPEEINVKVVDNSIIVEAKHEEKEDKFGFISRQFTRRFVLPEGVILEKMSCKMASDNVIVISAPRLVEKPPTNERTIPINFVGQPLTRSPVLNVNEVNNGDSSSNSTISNS